MLSGPCRDDMFKIIRTRCDGFGSVDECFNARQPGALFDEIGDAYEELIDMVLGAVPRARVFLHNYDRAIPTGKGFAGRGNWLKEPMDRAHIASSLQQGIVNRLLFECTERLKDQRDALGADSSRGFGAPGGNRRS